MPGGGGWTAPGTLLGREGGAGTTELECAPGSDGGGGGVKPGADGAGVGTAEGEPIPIWVFPSRAFRSILGFFALSSAIGSSEAGHRPAIDVV
jgi:hypothetical protein